MNRVERTPVPVEFAHPIRVREAAERLGEDPETVLGWILEGRLRGGPDRSWRVVVDADAVQELLDAAGTAERSG